MQEHGLMDKLIKLVLVLFIHPIVIMFNNVLYVLEANKKLVTIQHLASNSEAFIVFGPNYFLVKD
jgi:hypothetical protein